MRAVHLQAVFYAVFLIVGALHQRFARHIVFAIDLGRVEFGMVGAPGRGVGAASAHALDDGVKRHVNLQHVIQFDARILHGIGLAQGAGKAVKEKAVGAVRLLQALLDQIDDDVVAHQTTHIHDLFRLQPEWCASSYRRAQHVTG